MRYFDVPDKIYFFIIIYLCFIYRFVDIYGKFIKITKMQKKINE